MNPKPFSSLNHLTVPRISVTSLLVAEATNVLQSGPDKAELLAPGSSGETDATTATTVADSLRAPRSTHVGRALRAGNLPRTRTGRPQEVPDHRSDLTGMGQEEEVSPASHDVQVSIRDQPGHEPGVDERHDRILVAGDHQGGVGDPAEPGKAGPACGSNELPEEASCARGSLPERLGESLEELGVALDATPVDGGGDAFQMPGSVVPQRIGQLDERPGPTRERAEAERGGSQHQAPDPLRSLVGELLGEASAPGNPHHIHLVVAEGPDDARGEAGKPRNRERPGRERGFPHPGEGEGDRLASWEGGPPAPPDVPA